MNLFRSGFYSISIFISLLMAQPALAEINSVDNNKLSEVDGQFLITGLVGAYVLKEIIVGEIIGEAVSVSEDVMAKANLFDAVRPNNDTGPIGTYLKLEVVGELLTGGADTKNLIQQLRDHYNNF
jgi:hypothetical protein